MKNLSAWKRDWSLMTHFFKEDEIETVNRKVGNLGIRHVVYCSFENRFARSGGLGAVAMNILPWLNEAPGLHRSSYLITPFYPHIIGENKLEKTGKSFKVAYRKGWLKKKVKVEIYRYRLEYGEPVKGMTEEYYLKARGFFDAKNRINDPYLYHEDDARKNDEILGENALFFCKAVPMAMAALGIGEDIVFHLQEWQTALIALTSKEAMLEGTLTSCGTAQTLHNSFDSGLSLNMLEKITAKKRLDNRRIREGLTALQVGLQLVDAPITSVSGHFAEELTADILQTRHFAPHLQEIFKRSGVYGVNNGMFADFPPEFSRPAKESFTIDEIEKIKLAKRKALLDILDRYRPNRRFGVLTYRGTTITALPDSIPILVMSGRLDLFQKGYDIFLRAIQRFAEDEIKVILTPMPVKDCHLDYFRETARRCSGNLTVFPIRMEKGFRELQMGSTYGIMPSIYEPFGAAIEYMVNGTVTIARETGGLIGQIDHMVNGFLYREEPGCYTEANIAAFVRTGDNVQEREDNPWVRGMVDALYKTLKQAAVVYQSHRDDYYRMIVNGFKKAETFSWQKSVEGYFKVFGKINPKQEA